MKNPSAFNQFFKRLLSPLGLHVVGFSILAIATLVLGIRVGLDWRTTSESNQDAMATRRAQLKAFELQTAPLRGLDKRVADSRKQIDTFYAKRIPPSYSAILEKLGELEATSHVQLTRVQYTQAVGSGDLTEIKMDAGLTGDYPAILRFINGMERSQTFFLIRTMALTGQQSGAVGLRLSVSTWLRPADAAASGIAIEGDQNNATPNTQAPDADGKGQ